MQDTLFTSDLMALRKRRANVGRELRALREQYNRQRRYSVNREALMIQYSRTFLHLTVVELRLTDKVTP